MTFQLADTVNREKVFLIKWSELEGRFDPIFYKELSKYEGFHKLGSYVIVAGGKRIPAGMGYSETATDYRYLRVDNIDSDGRINWQNVKYISSEIYEILERYELKVNEVVISIAGTIGKITQLPNNNNSKIILTENCAKLVRKNDKLLADFLRILLASSIVQEQLKLNYIQTTIPKLGLGRIANLFIPPPPALEVQNQIITRMNAAYTAKKQKEAQTHEMLDSIDSYLLRELGIELPLEEENSISRRMFVRRFSEVSGGRFDAPSNWNRLSLASTTFDNVAFASQVEINPLTDLSFADDTTEASFVPMEAVSEVYAEADLNQKRSLAESKGYTVFQDADLIWAKITPCMENGKSAVVQDLLNSVGFGSTEFHVFRRKGSVDINYIHALLRLKCLRKNAVNYFSGSAGHQRVDELFFRKLTIPLPPLEKQNEIAAHIQAIRNRAKQLRAEAAAGLEQAKQEVEAMILGQA